MDKMDKLENISVLVTGGAGFIGSNIVEYLMDNNVKKIRILDNLVSGKMSNIENFLNNDNIEFTHGDVKKIEDCVKAVEDMDVICHQVPSESLSRCAYVPLCQHISNVNGFQNILLAAKESNIRRIVYASGCHYQVTKKEHDTKNIQSTPNVNKEINDIYAEIFTKYYGMECIGLRYCNIYGPKQDPNCIYSTVIPKFIDLMKQGKKPIINDGESFSSDFSFVTNAAQANYLGLTTKNDKCFGEVFNIGAGDKFSISEIFNIIKKELKIDIEPIFENNISDGIFHGDTCIDNAKKMLGYVPNTLSNEGIIKTIRYHCQKKTNIILLEDIDYNKLLNRHPIHINLTDTKDFLEDKQILITGGCGSIGSEIIRQLIQLKINNLIVYDNSEYGIFNFRNELRSRYDVGSSSHLIQYVLGDIRDKYKLKKIFEMNNIDIVFHAAAYKHVPLMEYYPDESIKTNIIGTKNVADLSLKHNVNKFIMISTDKAVNPTNIMGVCKRISELYINSLNNKNLKSQFVTTRFGNVLGSSGSVIPTFLKKINSNNNLRLTHMNITRYFMTIPEAAQLVLHSSFLGNGGEILLFDMGKPVKIYDLAKKMISIYGNSNISIDVKELRPGEKLYEELLCSGENLIPTENKKIMKLMHDKDIDYDLYFHILKKIINFEYCDKSELKKLLKKIVPDYKYN
jgi:FlaA1/EpsC-like NDP-sugar epimerase